MRPIRLSTVLLLLALTVLGALPASPAHAAVAPAHAEAAVTAAEAGEAAGEAARTPWSGWWWPASEGRGASLFAVGGPLAKYDGYAAYLTGTDPDTRTWERTHVFYQAYSWAGHCNGWAAAALLEPEPTEARELGGITFTIGDQKGLLADYHFADGAAWRYGVDNDLAPADFHRMLLRWLRDRQKGFGVTFDLGDEGIWNFPAYKFESEWTPLNGAGDRWTVTTTLWMAGAFVSPDFLGLQDYPGPGGKVIRYTLEGSPENPTGGAWISGAGNGRPASIWYPDPKARNVDRQWTSPNLTRDILDRILGNYERIQERRAFIRQQYIDLLGRDPAQGDSAGLESWVESDYGLDELRGQILVAGLAERTALIRRIYLDYLGRDPGTNDQAGLRAWATSILTMPELRDAIRTAGAAERREAIRQLYLKLLGRDPSVGDTAGLQSWIDSPFTLDQIAGALRNSPEYASRRV